MFIKTLIPNRQFNENTKGFYIIPLSQKMIYKQFIFKTALLLLLFINTVYSNPDTIKTESDSSEKISTSSLSTRKVRYFIGAEFGCSVFLGGFGAFGPACQVGMEINRKHILALSYYWGVIDDFYGGGINYMYSFIFDDCMFLRVGAAVGNWMDFNSIGSESYGTRFCIGGPKFRFEVQYKNLSFTILEGTFLIGTTINPLAKSGVSFRF